EGFPCPHRLGRLPHRRDHLGVRQLGDLVSLSPCVVPFADHPVVFLLPDHQTGHEQRNENAERAVGGQSLGGVHVSVGEACSELVGDPCGQVGGDGGGDRGRVETVEHRLHDRLLVHRVTGTL